MQSNVYTLDTRSLTVTPVTNDGASYNPQWSSDGMQLSYISYFDDTITTSIYGVTVGRTTTILQDTGGYPLWVQNNQGLLFSTNEFGRTTFFTLDVDHDVQIELFRGRFLGAYDVSQDQTSFAYIKPFNDHSLLCVYHLTDASESCAASPAFSSTQPQWSN